MWFIYLLMIVGDDLSDLRTKPFGKGSDVDIIDHAKTLNNHEVHTLDQREAQDPIQGLGGSKTRARAKLSRKLCKRW